MRLRRKAPVSYTPLVDERKDWSLKDIEEVLDYLEGLLKECEQEIQVAALCMITIRNGQMDPEAASRFAAAQARIVVIEEIYTSITRRGEE